MINYRSLDFFSNSVTIIFMHILDYIKHRFPIVENQISAYQYHLPLDISKLSGQILQNYYSELFDQLQGWKRVRAILVALWYQMYWGVDAEQKILPTIIAYEMFQTGILIQDDWMDLAATRRGKPTTFANLGSSHLWNSLTVILWDIGLFIANWMPTLSQIEPLYVNRAISWMNQTLQRCGEWQLLDMHLAKEYGMHAWRTQADAEYVRDVGLHKTASYTTTWPLVTWALLAWKELEQLDKLIEFADRAWVIFQYVDDYLWIFGEPDTTWKSVVSDILEWKATLLSYYMWNKASDIERGSFRNYYWMTDVDAKELSQIKHLLTDSWAVAYLHEQIDLEYELAIKLIPEITQESDYQQLLLSLLDYFIKRNK